MPDPPPHQKKLNDERLRNALAGTTIVWAKAVLRIYRQIVIRKNDDAFSRLLVLEEHLMMAYLLVLGLRQIAEHLTKMKRIPYRYTTRRFPNAAKAFLREYEKEDIRTCRNLLEHHADHLVGDGRYQRFVDEIELYRLGLGGRMQDDDATIAFSIEIFGRHYYMDSIIRCIEELLAAFDDPGAGPAGEVAT